MIRLIHSALILTLVLTGIALGSARGQARVADQVVICAGSTTVTIAVDHDGQPVHRTHFCPDMALSLLAALDVPPVALPRQPLHRAIHPIPQRDGLSRDLPARSARDPPSALS